MIYIISGRGIKRLRASPRILSKRFRTGSQILFPSAKGAGGNFPIELKHIHQSPLFSKRDSGARSYLGTPLVFPENHAHIQTQGPIFFLEDPEGVDVDLADFGKIAEKL